MSPSRAARVQTVLSPIEPSELGFTLPHEHTAISLWHIPGRWDYWELSRDEPVITQELARYRDAGGSALVDVTPAGVGRDPAWLVGLARATGLHLVMGTGWYRGAYYPATLDLDRRTVASLADEMVREAEEGIVVEGLDAPVRAGIIGEIGTDKPWVSAMEERVHRAVGRASRRSGLAITTHAVMSAVGLAQLELFEAEGADPGRVVIGHADSHPRLDHYLEIIRRGANLEFDFLGMSFTPQERHGEPRLIDLLLELLSRGHADRVLLSQDVCHDQQLKRYEGNGYTYLQDTFLPRLRERGVSQADIDQMTIANPRRILTID
ncbi:MAG: phosphotriesterase-related protein [Chloroflexi bacterium]|nr:phosphotriesterase-related protein [Chloroflexota bacterium]